MTVKSDHRSIYSNFSSWKEEAWKKLGLQRDSKMCLAILKTNMEKSYETVYSPMAPITPSLKRQFHWQQKGNNLILETR